MLIMAGCPERNSYEFYTKNNSNFDIVLYVIYGGRNIYPDTMFIFKPTGIIKSNVPISISQPLEDIIKKTPQDKLSFFFFHADTLEKYPLEVLQRDYKVLQRYDLSSQDVVTLKNKYGIPEIPYPPDERMKNMKMYPPYGSE